MSDYRAKGIAKADVPRLFWSVREFATATGISLDTAYRRLAAGEIAYTDELGEKRIPNSEIERLTADAMQRRTA